jgi:hypothetical protein
MSQKFNMYRVLLLDDKDILSHRESPISRKRALSPAKTLYVHFFTKWEICLSGKSDNYCGETLTMNLN